MNKQRGKTFFYYIDEQTAFILVFIADWNSWAR